MKEFINKHTRLYWTIVVTVAVFAFTIVTCIGCAKLEKANAAEEMTYCDAYVKACEFVGVGENDYSTLPYRLVHNAGSAYCTVLFNNESIAWGEDFSYAEYPYGVNVDRFIRVYADGSVTDMTGTRNIITGFSDILWANHDVLFRGNVVHANDGDFKPSMNYTYLINAPYAVIDDFTDYNEHLSTNFTKLENDEFTVEFSLGGQPMNPENGYLMDYTLYVWLPSKLYISNHYGDFTEQYFATQCGKDRNEFTADMKTWRYGVGTNGDSVLYKLPLKYEFYNNPETEAAGKYRIQLDYKDIVDYLEYAYGDGETDFSFKAYYDNENYTGYLWDFILSHMVVSRMDALVYTCIDDVDTYYGRTTTFTFLQNGNFIYSEVNKDALQNEDMESDISAGINQAIKDELIQTGDKVDELQQNINNASGSLGSFDTEFEGVDLWEGVKGVGTGLVGLTGFLGNLASVLGNLFVFLPYDVRQIAGYFFMASLVIALWKLIKR